MSDTAKKICFVVTPIGDKDTPIRRHIEGIIDHAIIPALESKYEVEVAHRKYEIGSINDRIINSIFEADLVIANLTTLNPNVMFELAIRYSFGKPAIVIAEQGTKLPFDIIDENTIFYENDPTGVNELKELLIKFEKNIDFSESKFYGPVIKAINNNPKHNEQKYAGVELIIVLDNIELFIEKKIDKLIDIYWTQNWNLKVEKQLENVIHIKFWHPIQKHEINFMIRDFAGYLKSLIDCTVAFKYLDPL